MCIWMVWYSNHCRVQNLHRNRLRFIVLDGPTMAGNDNLKTIFLPAASKVGSSGQLLYPILAISLFEQFLCLLIDEVYYFEIYLSKISDVDILIYLSHTSLLILELFFKIFFFFSSMFRCYWTNRTSSRTTQPWTTLSHRIHMYPNVWSLQRNPDIAWLCRLRSRIGKTARSDRN